MVIDAVDSDSFENIGIAVFNEIFHVLTIVFKVDDWQLEGSHTKENRDAHVNENFESNEFLPSSFLLRNALFNLFPLCLINTRSIAF